MTTDPQRQKAISTLAEMTKSIRIAMLTTVLRDGTLRSRPMISAEPEFDGQLWFFTELEAPKVAEVEDHPQVNVSFASPHDHHYVSISGTAELVRDNRKVEFLWDKKYGDWFPKGMDASKLGFLKVTVESAEFWDASSSRMVKIAGFAKAIFGGRHARPAEHGKIEWPDPNAEKDAPRENS